MYIQLLRRSGRSKKKNDNNMTIKTLLFYLKRIRRSMSKTTYTRITENKNKKTNLGQRGGTRFTTTLSPAAAHCIYKNDIIIIHNMYNTRARSFTLVRFRFNCTPQTQPGVSHRVLLPLRCFCILVGNKYFLNVLKVLETRLLSRKYVNIALSTYLFSNGSSPFFHLNNKPILGFENSILRNSL